MGSFVIIKRSIALFLVLFSCIYFFIINNSNTEQVTEIQVAPPLKLEMGNSECKPTIAHAEEITEKETLTEDQKHEDILNVHAMNTFDSKNAFKRQTKNNIERRFYASVSGGKVYSDNSETFVNGIQAIGKRVLTLVESSYGPMIKNIVAKEIKSIQEFKGEINFQWLSSASLGYYAGKNGRIDFETMYSKVNITQGSNVTPIFDKSAGIFTFLLNLYYSPDIQNTQFAPYIGLGIGPTIFRLKKVNTLSEDLMPLNVPWFAYQVKFGVDYSIIPEIKTFLGYRYFSIPIPVADDIATHNIEVGLLFNF